VLKLQIGMVFSCDDLVMKFQIGMVYSCEDLVMKFQLWSFWYVYTGLPTYFVLN
jgi:hypothetical protein